VSNEIIYTISDQPFIQPLYKLYMCRTRT